VSVQLTAPVSMGSSSQSPAGPPGTSSPSRARPSSSQEQPILPSGRIVYGAGSGTHIGPQKSQS